MAATRPLARHWFSTHHNAHKRSHNFLKPNSYIGSWDPPKDPKDALKKLGLLRREYNEQFKQVRKEYVNEIETMRLDKLKKEEVEKEAIRVANEERKMLKAEVAKLRAQQREVAEQEFQKLLVKEKTEKLKNWRMKEQMKEAKKKKNDEHMWKQSSTWIEESELESKALDAMVKIQRI